MNATTIPTDGPNTHEDTARQNIEGHENDEQQQNAELRSSPHLGSLGVHPAMYGLNFTAVGAALHRRKNWDRPPNIGPIPRHALSNEYQMLIVRRMVDAYMNISAAFDRGRHLGFINNAPVESPASPQFIRLREGRTERIDVEVQCWKMLEHLYQFYDFGCKLSEGCIERYFNMQMNVDNWAGWDSRVETLIDHLKCFKCMMHEVMYETDRYWALFRAPNLVWAYTLQEREQIHQSWWTQSQEHAMRNRNASIGLEPGAEFN
ncbi:MAG: hypothetical protein M1831_006595 [Alyxoria varia]|nr:MAG: hypothetical protein M1831_006595 [Alyxoria varia]